MYICARARARVCVCVCACVRVCVCVCARTYVVINIYLVSHVMQRYDETSIISEKDTFLHFIHTRTHARALIAKFIYQFNIFFT